MLVFASLLLPRSGPALPVNVEQVIQRSVEANRRDWMAAPHYSYREQDSRPNGGSKNYQVTMILGSPYNRLVAIDGEPLSPAAQRRQEQLLKATTAHRGTESPSQRAARTAEYQKERRRDRLFLDQLTAAFNFKLTGREQLNHRETYVLKAVPKPGYQPPVFEARVLKGMQGTLWIDAATGQWVRVEAQVIHPVYIAGFLARVDPGTRFELEYAPVDDGIWLPTHFAMHSRAKVLLLLTRRKSADQSYSDYQRIGPADADQSR
jgi:hypothetical protein